MSITAEREVRIFLVAKKGLIALVLLLLFAELTFVYNMLDRGDPRSRPGDLPSGSDPRFPGGTDSMFTILNSLVVLISALSIYYQVKTIKKVDKIKRLEKYGHDSRQLPQHLVR